MSAVSVSVELGQHSRLEWHSRRRIVNDSDSQALFSLEPFITTMRWEEFPPGCNIEQPKTVARGANNNSSNTELIYRKVGAIMTDCIRDDSIRKFNSTPFAWHGVLNTPHTAYLVLRPTRKLSLQLEPGNTATICLDDLMISRLPAMRHISRYLLAIYYRRLHLVPPTKPALSFNPQSLGIQKLPA